MTRGRIFQRGESVPVWGEVKDWAGTYIDPVSVKVTITKPDGTASVTAQSMTRSETGRYVYYYDSDAADLLGWWRTMIETVDGSSPNERHTITHGGFELQ